MHAFRSSGLLLSPKAPPSRSLAGGALLSTSESTEPRQEEEEEEALSDLEDLPQPEPVVVTEDENFVENNNMVEDGSSGQEHEIVIDKSSNAVKQVKQHQTSVKEEVMVEDTEQIQGEVSVKLHDLVENSNEARPTPTVEQEDDLVELSIQLLQVFMPHTQGPSDPVLALTTFYQKKGIVSTKEYFQEHKVGSGAFWFSFACPLNGVEYTSGLPLGLFEPEPRDDRLVTLASKIFGNVVIKKNQVVFGTKKGAKRAVAYAVLEAHQQTGMARELIVSASEIGGAQQDEDGSPVKVSRKSLRNLAGWVHELYRMGIDANSIEISYRQHFSGEEPLSPCQLCCILSVQQPSQLTAISLPCPSKRLAAENAVLLLIAELERTASSDPPVQRGQSQLAKIQQCNPTRAIYMKPLPLWANNPIQRKAVLYRVRFLTTVGTDFVSSRSGVGVDVLTPFGIIFFAELPSPIAKKEQFEADFEMHSAERDKQERVTIQLSHPTKIDLSESAHECIEFVELFNEKVHLWKDYGQQSSFIGTQKTGNQPKTSISLLNRTYLFVPLAKEEATLVIDWELLRSVATNETTRYLTGLDQDWWLPLLGPVDLLFVSATFGFISVAIMVPDLMFLAHSLIGDSKARGVSVLYRNEESTIGSYFAVLSIITFIMYLAWPPQKNFTPRQLQNRFMVEQKDGPRPLHVTPSKDNFHDPLGYIESKLTGRSKVYNPNGPGPSEGARESNLRKHNIDLRTASLVELYRKKFQITVRYPDCRLLFGIPFNRHPDQDFFFAAKDDRLMKFIPELVHILPMPRDALYMLRHANLFMPALEQAIEFDKLAACFNSSLTSLASTLPIKWPDTDDKIKPELGSRLAEALGDGTYQRLEFLGDSVLGFFLAVNLMARNSSLTWDTNDLSQIFTDASKNTILYDASLNIGAGALIRTGAGNVTWRSAFQANRRGTPLSMSLEMIQAISHSREANYLVVKVTDKAMSDTVESLLGAVFLAGKSGDSWCMKNVIGLLEKLRIPISGHCEDGSSDLPWFRGTSPCVSNGYDFGQDQPWQAQLIKIGTSLYCDEDVSGRLEHGFQRLVTLMIELSGDETLSDKLSFQQSKLLLLCALFDDSLKDMQDDTPVNSVDVEPKPQSLSTDSEEQQTTKMEPEIIQAALLRDTLVLVGSSAFELCLTTDLFHRYPDANEGDLHILRACAKSHDVEVYIMFKAGIHKFLLDQDAPSISRFESMVEMADVLGKAEWLKRDGWTLPGGASEFAARCHTPQHRSNSDTNATRTPQYFGLAGGRLRGQKGEQQKLPESITSDHTFSMNAIIGALVLSIGLEGMWNCIGPLFDEVMLLSPSELRREYGALSSIIR